MIISREGKGGVGLGGQWVSDNTALGCLLSLGSSKTNLINRPGEAGAVLQKPLSLIHSLSQSVSHPLCQLSQVMCHMSRVTRHMSNVTCHTFWLSIFWTKW